MAMKKATKDRLTDAFRRGYDSGYADGKRAAQVEADSQENAASVFETQIDQENDTEQGDGGE